MNDDIWEFGCVVFFLVVFAFLGFVIGSSYGIDMVYDDYCHSLEYDDSDVIAGERYCIDEDNPEAILYIEWQE